MDPSTLSHPSVPSGICVLIPTYNNSGTLEDIIRGVLKFTPHVIVIDDGSTDATRDILNKFPEIGAIHHRRNMGKGLAIRNGFREAVNRGYEYAITIDSDGQHRPEDLPGFFKKIESSPDSLIIGARNLEQDGIPGGTAFGNRFSNFWTWVETGYRLPDTQSGYRLYPVRLLSKKRWFTRRFEFEIEVLVRAAWQGITIASIPVNVIYPPKNERITHFRPLIDFTRISLLNTVLTLLALLIFRPIMLYRRFRRENFRDLMRKLLLNPEESNFRKAASVGLGVFMGIAPVWGWQMAIALALAFLFRLNKTITLIASNISIPPLIPPILFVSYLAGGLVMSSHKPISYSSGLTFEMFTENLLQYIVGALAFGLAMGLLAAALTWVLLIAFQRRKNPHQPT